MERQDKISAAKNKLMEALVTDADDSANADDVSDAFKDLEKTIYNVLFENSLAILKQSPDYYSMQ